MSDGQLQQIDDGLWCLDSHFVVWGCKGSVRMTLIETRDGLVVYSPVTLAAAQIKEIERMGRVATIIAPNLYHHAFLRPCMAAFPKARVWVPDGLEAKIGKVPGSIVASNDRDLGASGELAHHVFHGHRLRETILFHRTTATLITADLLYNLQSENFPAEKLFFRLIGSYGIPSVAFYHRFAVEDKASVRELMRTVRGWPVRRIVMCHGRIVTADAASEIFSRAWARFA